MKKNLLYLFFKKIFEIFRKHQFFSVFSLFRNSSRTQVFFVTRSPMVINKTVVLSGVQLETTEFKTELKSLFLLFKKSIILIQSLFRQFAFQKPYKNYFKIKSSFRAKIPSYHDRLKSTGPPSRWTPAEIRKQGI